jgi:hypothetical protein
MAVANQPSSAQWGTIGVPDYADKTASPEIVGLFALRSHLIRGSPDETNASPGVRRLTWLRPSMFCDTNQLTICV